MPHFTIDNDGQVYDSSYIKIDAPRMIPESESMGLAITANTRQLYDLELNRPINEQTGFISVFYYYGKDKLYLSLKDDGSLYSFNYNHQVDNWMQAEGSFQHLTVFLTRGFINCTFTACHNGAWSRIGVVDGEFLISVIRGNAPKIEDVIDVRSGLIRTRDYIHCLLPFKVEFMLYMIKGNVLTYGLECPVYGNQRTLVILYQDGDRIIMDSHNIILAPSAEVPLDAGLQPYRSLIQYTCRARTDESLALCNPISIDEYQSLHNDSTLTIGPALIMLSQLKISTESFNLLNSQSPINRFTRINKKDVLLLKNGNSYCLKGNYIIKTDIPTIIFSYRLRMTKRAYRSILTEDE